MAEGEERAPAQPQGCAHCGGALGAEHVPLVTDLSTPKKPRYGGPYCATCGAQPPTALRGMRSYHVVGTTQEPRYGASATAPPAEGTAPASHPPARAVLPRLAFHAVHPLAHGSRISVAPAGVAPAGPGEDPVLPPRVLSPAEEQSSHARRQQAARAGRAGHQAVHQARQRARLARLDAELAAELEEPNADESAVVESSGYVDPVREDGEAGAAAAEVTLTGGANPLLLGTAKGDEKKTPAHHCTVGGCGREQYARGLCTAHYKRRVRGNARRAEVRGYERRAPSENKTRETQGEAVMSEETSVLGRYVDPNAPPRPASSPPPAPWGYVDPASQPAGEGTRRPAPQPAEAGDV